MTIGADFLVKTMEIDNKKIKLQIWDIGGQEQFRFLMTMYIRGSVGALLLFDLTRKDTFESLPSWLDELRKVYPDDSNFPIILIGNKADLNKLREVSFGESIDFAKFEKCFGYIETSAKTGENIEKTFEVLVRAMIKYCKSGKYYPPKEPIEPKPSNTQELIYKKVLEILQNSPKKGTFRFLIFGDENAQKPLLSKLLRAEKIDWPPKTHTILYNTLNYTINIDRKKYKVQLFFLSNVNRLNRLKTGSLFKKAYKNADGVVIFYDPRSPEGFSQAVDMGKWLKYRATDLEIILTTGSDNPPTLFHELERLENEGINNSDDYNSLISEILINTLKRKKKINREVKYAESKLKEIQEQLYDQKIRSEFMAFILSKEKINDTKDIQTEKAVISSQSSSKNTIFISYSHKDKVWLDRVTTHLKLLKKERDISHWNDTRIKPGEKWEKKIMDSLNSSKVAILLVSADFLASDFIVNNELPPLLDAAEKGGTIILPVFISESRYDLIKLIPQTQAINDPKEPLLSLSKNEQERVFVKLSHAVEDAFKNL